MPETFEEEGKGDVSPIGLFQVQVDILEIRAAETGALVDNTDGLALIDLHNTVKAGDAHSLDPWETVQLVHDCLAAAV